MAFTYFFRDIFTLELAAEQVIPYARGFSKIKIWDAGSALGQEPYSMAIVLAERLSTQEYNRLELLASDLDPNDQFGPTIINGVYPYSELSRIPVEIFKKYFTPTGQSDDYLISEQVRKQLIFLKHDLLTLTPPGDNYHLILCKNVLLHFSPEERVQVYRMFHKALAPGGFLANEHTQKMPDELTGLFSQVRPNAQLWKKL